MPGRRASNFRCSRLPPAGRSLDFWQAKFDANVERDRRSVAALEAAGWAVVVIWEREAVDQQLLKARLLRLIASSEVPATVSVSPAG